jgi:hypothetical protein
MCALKYGLQIPAIKPVTAQIILHFTQLISTLTSTRLANLYICPTIMLKCEQHPVVFNYSMTIAKTINAVYVL